MTPISERPTIWAEVVGQERAVRMLHALIRSPRFMTRGFIFEGPHAVGKTSCAYLFSRALMCMSADPLTCTTCASCVEAINGLDNHNSFVEINGAQTSKVEQARELHDRLNSVPVLGKRLVVLVDEAHRLSPEAFDVFLMPLERKDTDVIFLFVSSKGEDIAGAIRSRCAVIEFEAVDEESLVGMLMNQAEVWGVGYKNDGLRRIARYAQGRPRDAKKGLALTAALGDITTANVALALNTGADAVCGEIFTALRNDQLAEAIKKTDALAYRIGPVRTISELFGWFARDVFTATSVTASFAPLKDMSTFFVKWSMSSKLPTDVMPIFVVELNEMRAGQYKLPDAEQKRPTRPALLLDEPPTPTTPKKGDRVVSAAEAFAILES